MIEVAFVISNKGFTLFTTFGSVARVDFPDQWMWETHKRFPGLIRIMVHSHPEGMPYMSEEDRTTLKAWTIALAPYPIFMEVVTYNDGELSRMRYWYERQSLQNWIESGKQGTRKMELMRMSMTGDFANWIRDLMSLSNNLK